MSLFLFPSVSTCTSFPVFVFAFLTSSDLPHTEARVSTLFDLGIFGVAISASIRSRSRLLPPHILLKDVILPLHPQAAVLRPHVLPKDVVLPLHAVVLPPCTLPKDTVLLLGATALVHLAVVLPVTTLGGEMFSVLFD